MKKGAIYNLHYNLQNKNSDYPKMHLVFQCEINNLGIIVTKLNSNKAGLASEGKKCLHTNLKMSTLSKNFRVVSTHLYIL